jgi:ABC-type polysaccharide/polyol phosphate export permease
MEGSVNQKSNAAKPTSEKSSLRPRARAGTPETRLRVAGRRAVREHELLWNLVLRDLRSRYRRTAMGWLWSMINPAMMTLIYSFVFTVFFDMKPIAGIPSGMSSYAFYLLAGLLPWNALVNGVNGASAALVGGGGLMTKVRFAREHLVLATVLAMTVSLTIELILLAALELFGGYNSLKLLPIVLILVFLLTLFISGIGLIVAALNIRYRDVQHLMSIGFLVWFYLTPVVYPAHRIPEHYSAFGRVIPLRTILGLNPMSRFLLAFRNCFYDVTVPGFETMVGLLAISVGTFFIGYRFFVRRSPWFVEDL